MKTSLSNAGAYVAAARTVLEDDEYEYLQTATLE